ncbi:MAG: DUF3291 domain-containing protein [Pseudomonadota bacterium]
MSSEKHIAHFNWGRLKAPIGDPLVAEFVDNAARVNEIAERSDGFIWRDGGEGTSAWQIGWPLFTETPTMIASFSVWESPQQLWQFVHKTVHGQFLRRGADWFHASVSYNYALWWVEPGHQPDIYEARDRVEALRANGPSAEVFTFKEFPPERLSAKA